MKYGHRIIGKIEDADDRGRGVLMLREGSTIRSDATETDGATDQTDHGHGYQLGKGTVAIPFTMPGDEIIATFTRRDHGTKIAKLESVTTASTDRVHAPCPHAGVCGGCLWQHMQYDAQLRLKKEMINRAFERAGHGERVDEVLPCHSEQSEESRNPSEGSEILRRLLTPQDDTGAAPFFYRNRMDYAVGWLGTIGLKEYDAWNRYLDLSDCLLLSPETPKILEAARDLMKKLEWEPWDAKHHTGLFRYVVIREGKNTRQRMVMLVVSDLEKISSDARAAILDALSPFCTSLLIGEQSLVTDVSYVQRAIAIKGETYLEECINDIAYRIAPNSFFQTNSAMAAELQKIVESFTCRPEQSSSEAEGPLSESESDSSASLGMTEQRTILDLYCGLGFFGIALAKHDSSLHIHGHELDAEAIELARHNATVNGVSDRCTFTAGPSEDLSWKDIEAATIILDPPRAGLHPRVIDTLLEKKPKIIVYISCNYHRLVEELKKFKTAYQIDELRALDLFPHTPHVEVVVRMMKINSNKSS